MKDKKNDNVYVELTQKIMTDAEFRAEMRSDPKACIEKFLGRSLPKKYTIKVMEPDPKCSLTMLLLPRKDLLSDESLDSVAGGVSDLGCYRLDLNNLKNNTDINKLRYLDFSKIKA